ncbi:MAG: hypothetical protein ACRC62_01730 [Microcoleus sp.]
MGIIRLRFELSFNCEGRRKKEEGRRKREAGRVDIAIVNHL